MGASIYDVRRGWGEGVPKKQTKGKRLRESGCDKGEGVKKSENVADVIYGSPLYKKAKKNKELSSVIDQSLVNFKVCVDVKLWILVLFLAAGMAGYVMLEVLLRRRKMEDEDGKAKSCTDTT